MVEGCVCSDLSLKIVSRKIPPPLPSGNGYLIFPGEVREEEGDGCLRLSHTVIRHSEPLRLCELFTPSFFCKNYFQSAVREVCAVYIYLIFFSYLARPEPVSQAFHSCLKTSVRTSHILFLILFGRMEQGWKVGAQYLSCRRPSWTELMTRKTTNIGGYIFIQDTTDWAMETRSPWCDGMNVCVCGREFEVKEQDWSREESPWRYSLSTEQS